jgi:hypothetical protein
VKHVVGILLGLLVISVGANVYQFATRRAGPSDGPIVVRVGETCQREDVWYPKTVRLGETGYEACAGAWVYPRPKVYTVSVVRPFDGGSRTLFEREFRVDELPDGFLDRPADQVVAFDPETRTVTFSVGDRQFDYRLPTAGE